MFLNFVEIIPVEETYFVTAKKPPNINLSDEAVILNYKDLSPFENGDMIVYQTKDRIFIWFVKYPLDRERKKIFIPEGYIIYKQLKKVSNSDEVIALYYKNWNTVVSVVKNGILLSQTMFQREHFDKKLELIKKEYSLSSPEIIKVNQLNLKISFKDIIVFSNFSINKSQIAQVILENLIPVFALSLLFLTAFNVGFAKYLEGVKSENQLYLQSLKEKNKDIKRLIYELREMSSFWRHFVKKEMLNPNFYSLLNDFTQVVKENNGYINYFEMNGNQISAWIGVKSGNTKVINDLLNTGTFKKIKIISSANDRERKGYDILNLEITLAGNSNE